MPSSQFSKATDGNRSASRRSKFDGLRVTVSLAFAFFVVG